MRLRRPSSRDVALMALMSALLAAGMLLTHGGHRDGGLLDAGGFVLMSVIGMLRLGELAGTSRSRRKGSTL